MANDRRTDGQAARDEATAARHAAEAAAASVGEIVHRLDGLRDTTQQMTATLADTRADIARVEQHVEKTNGRMTRLEEWRVSVDIWRAELRGIAQGAGGTGKLITYIFGAAASAGTVVAVIMKMLER